MDNANVTYVINNKNNLSRDNLYGVDVVRNSKTNTLLLNKLSEKDRLKIFANLIIDKILLNYK